MNVSEYNDFNKRYDKFKKNNLPTPFWDDERQTFEYVSFVNEKSSINSNNRSRLKVDSSIVEALGEIANVNLYYPFTTKYLTSQKENGELIDKVIIEKGHTHSFDNVVKALYNAPESFRISEEDESFYSAQELYYLKRVQKYLLFIGMKDVETRNVPRCRYRNKMHDKYKNTFIYKINQEILKNILSRKINFFVMKCYSDYYENKKYKPKEYQALIVDDDDNFKMLIEFTEKQVKLYKEIKNIYPIESLSDDEKVMVTSFKILELF